VPGGRFYFYILSHPGGRFPGRDRSPKSSKKSRYSHHIGAFSRRTRIPLPPFAAPFLNTKIIAFFKSLCHGATQAPSIRKIERERLYLRKPTTIPNMHVYSLTQSYLE
jgi:hypothetical protein